MASSAYEAASAGHLRIGMRGSSLAGHSFQGWSWTTVVGCGGASDQPIYDR
jgi:hypothetical protein